MREVAHKPVNFRQTKVFESKKKDIDNQNIKIYNFVQSTILEKQAKMIEKRQQKILETLSRQKAASVGELSDQLGVSAVTIRTDLNQLAKAGRVVRTHGGAQLAGERLRQETSFATRQQMFAEQKRAIGRLAASLVQPNESILLDASTTAVAVGHALKEMRETYNVTAVTTGIWTALELLGAPHINVVLCGGQVRNTTGSIAGSITNETLAKFHFSKAFLGGWGITLENGLTDSPLMEVELKKLVVNNSQETIAVVDSSKFGRVGLATFATIDQISHIITTNETSNDTIENYRNSGSDVLVAELS